MRQDGCSYGHGVRPSVRAAITSGRGRERGARTEPDRRSPPAADWFDVRGAAQRDRDPGRRVAGDHRGRVAPLARAIAATSGSSLPGSAPLTEPECR